MRNLKKNNLGIGLLAILVAAVFAPTLVHAKDYTVGVKAGDWVKYGQVRFTWAVNGTEPPYLTELKKLDWLRIDVLSVAGTTASLNLTGHFNNGTQTFQSFDADVQSSNLAGMSYLVASNLTAGDPLSSQAPENTINQTVTRLYAGANRNVNVIDVKSNLTIARVNYPGEYKVYWDQNTGVMVEAYSNQTDPTNSSAYVETSLKATETNLWSANAFDFIQNNLICIIAGIAVIIVIVAATIVLRSKKPPSSQEIPPTSAPPSPPPANPQQPNSARHEAEPYSMT
jgi:hypothetical protein